MPSVPCLWFLGWKRPVTKVIVLGGAQETRKTHIMKGSGSIPSNCPPGRSCPGAESLAVLSCATEESMLGGVARDKSNTTSPATMAEVLSLCFATSMGQARASTRLTKLAPCLASSKEQCPYRGRLSIALLEFYHHYTAVWSLWHYLNFCGVNDATSHTPISNPKRSSYAGKLQTDTFL